jgi:hypothetical protein
MIAPVSVETSLKLGDDSRLQTRSPARNIQSESAPAAEIAEGSEEASMLVGTGRRSEDERETAFSRGSRDGKTGERPMRLATSSEQGEQTVSPDIDERRGSNYGRLGEQPVEESDNLGEQRTSVDRGSLRGKTGEQSQRKRGSRQLGGRPGQVTPPSAAHSTPHSPTSENAEAAKSTPDYAPSGGGLSYEQATHWLKTVLPEASGGWWDVYRKDNGFAVKFRWRNQRRQTLTFPSISHQQLQSLRQSAPDEIRGIINERISASLRRFLLDPDKRDKALLVAQKLGIDPDNIQKFTDAN